jgi:dTMP kinase
MTQFNSQCAEPTRLPLFEHRYPGLLLVVEGLDGTGKTTLIAELASALTDLGHSVVLAKQPTSAVRQLPLFNRYQFEPEERSKIEYRALLALLLSDRFQNVTEVIRPALARGQIVLMDRYVYTLLVVMRARGYEEQWIIDACSSFPRPDSAWLLRPPFDVALQRVRSRTNANDAYIERELFARIYAHFDVLAAQGELASLDTHTNSPEVLVAHCLSNITNLSRMTLGGSHVY